MFCVHCGEQLPDGAKFCYNCGNKTFSKEDMPQPTPPATDEKPVQEPAEEPIYEPVNEPVYEPVNEPVYEPVQEPVYDPTYEPVQEPTPKKKVKPPKPEGAPSNKKKIIAIVGAAAVLIAILVAVIVATTSSGKETTIPDPEYYFALPLSETSQNDGMISYTLYANGDEDLTAAVYSYIRILDEDHDFMIVNNEEDDGYINTHLMAIGDSDGEVVVFYLHDSWDNMIVVKTTKNIRLESGLSYSGASSTIEDDITTEVGEKETNPYDTGNPAVLPDFTKVESSGTFYYNTSFLSTEYDQRLYTSFSSNDIFAIYVFNDYIEVLCDLGYVIDRIDEDNYYHLYHPDVNAPTLPGEKAQIIIGSYISDTGEYAYVHFVLPKEICIEGYETKYQEAKEWEEKSKSNNESSSSSNSSSGGSSSGGSSSGGSSSNFNKDLYDNDPICGVCNGDGDCGKCGGDGYLMSSASDKEDRNCYQCSGSGNCRSCGGDGRL